MESWVSPIPEEHGLVLVGHLVLGVSHLVVDGDEVLLVDASALLDAEVLAVVEVPGGGVADQLAVVRRLLDDAALPEFLQGMERERGDNQRYLLWQSDRENHSNSIFIPNFSSLHTLKFHILFTI